MKIVFKIVTGIISTIFLIVLIANFLMLYNNKKIPSLFGYSYVKMQDDSMEEAIGEGDLILVKTDLSDIKKDDIISYYIDKKSYVSRIVSYDKENYTVRGDNQIEDIVIEKSKVVGVYIGKATKMGIIVDLTTKPIGLLFLLFLTLIVIIIKTSK